MKNGFLRNVGAVYQIAIPGHMARSNPASRRMYKHMPQAVRSVKGRDILLLWKETIATFGAHSAGFLACATAIGLANVVTEPMFPSLVSPSGRLLALLVIRLFAQTAAQVAIRWIAVRPLTDTRLRSYPSRVFAWIALLPVAMIHGALVTCAVAAAWLPFNTALPAQVTEPGTTAGYFRYIAREAVSDNRYAWAFDPGSPWQTVLEQLQAGAQMMFNPQAERAPQHIYSPGSYSLTANDEANGRGPSTFVPPSWSMIVGCLGLMVVAETIFRFRAVAAVRGALAYRGKPDIKFWFCAARLSWQHFGLITVHIWLLRFLMLCVKLLLLSLPAALAKHLVLPHVNGLTGSMWPYQIGIMAVSASSSMIEGVIAAFCMVYDILLYRRLQILSRPQKEMA